MGKLFIIGTPIGNMLDISQRAKDTLTNVQYIAAEDTRVCQKLLTLLGINYKYKKILAYHNFNEKNSAKGIVQLLNEGFDVALVSDAGMPSISDPGFEIVNLVIKDKMAMEVIPGPSALIMAIVLANFGQEFSFLGFLKPKTIQRQNQLKKLNKGVYCTFVSPYKLISTLEDIKTVFGNEIEIFLGKELTKKFEKHYRGTVESVLNELENTSIQGEYTLVFKI